MSIAGVPGGDRQVTQRSTGSQGEERILCGRGKLQVSLYSWIALNI